MSSVSAPAHEPLGARLLERPGHPRSGPGGARRRPIAGTCQIRARRTRHRRRLAATEGQSDQYDLHRWWSPRSALHSVIDLWSCVLRVRSPPPELPMNCQVRSCMSLVGGVYRPRFDVTAVTFRNTGREGLMASRSLADRFGSQGDRSGAHHLWTGSRKSDGAGKLKIEGRTVTARCLGTRARTSASVGAGPCLPRRPGLRSDRAPTSRRWRRGPFREGQKGQEGQRVDEPLKGGRPRDAKP